MQSTIRFLHEWRGRKAGTTDTQMDYGVQQVLVQRGLAEFIDIEKPREPQRRRTHKETKHVSHSEDQCPLGGGIAVSGGDAVGEH